MPKKCIEYLGTFILCFQNQYKNVYAYKNANNIIASLTPKTTKLGFYLAYQNGIWLAAGRAGTSENNFVYGPDLATI